MSKFIIPEAALSQHTIALGKTRSGKSSKLRLIIEHFLDDKKPVCVIDPKGDWWGMKSSADGKKPGYPIIIFGSEHARHADIRINAHSGAGVAELIATGNRPCLIDLRGMRPGERTRFFIDFASTYFTKATGQRVLAIDEVHHFAPQGKIPDPQTGEMLHWANRLVNEAGGMGVTIMSASQRPQKVHKDFTSAHETLIACRVITKHDRDAVKDWIDACGDPALGKEVINSLASMQRTEAWVYSPEAGFGPSRLTFPMFKTYDSFKPQSAKRRGKLKGWASINLKEVEAKLTVVVEEAKANDPKELRKQITEKTKRIAELEAGSARAAAAKKPPDKDALERAQQRGVDQAKRTYAPLRAALEAAMKFLVEINAKDFFKAGGDSIDKKAVEKAITDATQHVTRLVEQHLASRDKKLDGLRLEAQRLAARLKAAIEKAGEDVTIQVDVKHNEPFTVRTSPKVAAPRPSGNGAASPAGDGVISGVMLETLGALAWWAALGIAAPTRKQLGVVIKVRPGGSTMRSRLAALVKEGLIGYPSGETVALTELGRAAAPAPNTSVTLLETIRSSLSAVELQTFDAIPPAPDAINRQDLGASLNVKPGGSTMRSRLAALTARELIRYPDGGTVARQDWVV